MCSCLILVSCGGIALDISIGTRNAYYIELTLNTRDNVIGCGIYITDSKDLFKSLYQNEAKIEEELQEQLEWLELPNKKASIIKITRKGNINN